MLLQIKSTKLRNSSLVFDLCLALGLLLPGACAVGQSGNEGDLPAAPCPHGGPLFEAEVVSLDSGCVTVKVKRILQQGEPVVDGNAAPLLDDVQLDAQLTAKLGTTYAYRHEFSAEDAVVVLPGLWGDQLEFQLLPRSSNGVEIWWGPRLVYASTDDLVAADCTARLEQLPKQDRSESEASTTVQTAPPPETMDCSAAAAP